MSSVKRFKFCTVGWQCAEFMQWTFDSIDAQEGEPWDAAIVYDPSTDNGADIIRDWCAKDPQHRKFRINTEKKFAVRNQYEAIYEMLQPDDDDVIVYLDLDGDKLSHPYVLRTLRAYYDRGVLLTYGQYRPIPDLGTSTFASEWPAEVIQNNSYRKYVLGYGTHFNHLRTVKGCIYKSIPESTFKWKNGEWYEGGTDYVTMISGLELAGGKHKFISEVILDYNHANPRADNKTHPNEAAACTVDFLRRPPLTPKDLKREAAKVPRKIISVPSNYLPAERRREIILDYAVSYGLRVFVETGTDQGATTWVMKDHFAQVYTIELGDQQWSAASRMLRGYPHVQCLHGDSGALLPQVLRQIQQPAMFWLDGHHSGPGTARGPLDTPIVQELEAIFNDGRPHVILVDDARCFLGGVEHPTVDEYAEPHYRDYPSLDFMEKFANDHGYKYLLSDDIMRMTPPG